MATVRTHVFTDNGGSQYLLCIYPTGDMTIARRPDQYAVWGPPIQEDEWYREREPRSIAEVVFDLTGRGVL